MTKQTGKSHIAVRALCEGAIMVALAQLLGYLKFYELPQGGSVTLALVPIFIFCARWGFGSGMIASFAFSLLQLFLDGAYAWGWVSIVLDYILGFTVLGFAGLFHKQKYGYFTGAVVGSLLRFLCSYIAGATVWADSMPENFFGMTMTTPWFYSALYNGFYCVINLLLAIVVGALLYKPMGKYLRGEDIVKK